MTISTVPIWLDCDPGTDDAFAILLALFHPQFKLLGISTVYGNAPIESTTRNTLGLLQILGINDVPVYMGENTPLVRIPRYALDIHGDSGLGGATLPEELTLKPQLTKYYDAMKDAILAHPHEICLVGVGTYTNIAILFKKYPELKPLVKYISVMGGAFEMGNNTKYAEFNVISDPHAANQLFHDEELMNKIIVNGLNITHTAMANESVRKRIYNPEGDNNSELRKTFYDILNFYYKNYKSRKDFIGPPLHDPLAVFNVLPMLDDGHDYNFEYIRRRITANEDPNDEREGETVFVNGSRISDPGNEPNGTIIGKKVDIDLFYEYVLEALDLADK